MRMASTFTWRRSRTAVVALIALMGVAACGSASEPAAAPDGSEPSTPGSTGADPITTSTPDATTPQTGDVTSTVGPDATTAPTVLADGVDTLGPTTQRLVDVAIADLVDRFDLTDVTPDDPIVVARAEEVTWRDGALGCPAKGMQYIQVLTPGVRIVLEHGGRSYAYHAGNGDPTYCAQPESPAPGG